MNGSPMEISNESLKDLFEALERIVIAAENIEGEHVIGFVELSDAIDHAHSVLSQFVRKK